MDERQRWVRVDWEWRDSGVAVNRTCMAEKNEIGVGARGQSCLDKQGPVRQCHNLRRAELLPLPCTSPAPRRAHRPLEHTLALPSLLAFPFGPPVPAPRRRWWNRPSRPRCPLPHPCRARPRPHADTRSRPSTRRPWAPSFTTSIGSNGGSAASRMMHQHQTASRLVSRPFCHHGHACAGKAAWRDLGLELGRADGSVGGQRERARARSFVVVPAPSHTGRRCTRVSVAVAVLPSCTGASRLHPSLTTARHGGRTVLTGRARAWLGVRLGRSHDIADPIVRACMATAGGKASPRATGARTGRPNIGEVFVFAPLAPTRAERRHAADAPDSPTAAPRIALVVSCFMTGDL